MRITLKTRMLTELVNGNLDNTFTLKEVRKEWNPNWHRKTGLYKSEGRLDDLFLHSFVHEGILPLKESKILRRISNGVYQVTRSGEKALQRFWDQI